MVARQVGVCGRRWRRAGAWGEPLVVTLIVVWPADVDAGRAMMRAVPQATHTQDCAWCGQERCGDGGTHGPAAAPPLLLAVRPDCEGVSAAAPRSRRPPTTAVLMLRLSVLHPCTAAAAAARQAGRARVLVVWCVTPQLQVRVRARWITAVAWGRARCHPSAHNPICEQCRAVRFERHTHHPLHTPTQQQAAAQAQRPRAAAVAATALSRGAPRQPIAAPAPGAPSSHVGS